MAINLTPIAFQELAPKIIVFGVGGAGGNAVNNMIEAKLQGVEFVVANTDSQALARSRADRRIQIGQNTTSGLGAGAQPQVGMAAAEESQEEIIEQLAEANMVFITAGMGGGTGTGAAPVIARTAKERGIVTIAVVTKPFHFEGSRRMRMAEAGIAELQKHVDTLIVIPNQNLFRVANNKTSLPESFKMADEVLNSGVRSITDLMVNPGIINLDFADVRNVMSEMGKAMMGTGEAEGEGRALKAATEAINNPLLEDVSLKGARAVLVNVCGGNDLTLYELDEATTYIRELVDPDANIIIGSAIDETLVGKVRVSVVATGIDAEAQEQPAVVPSPVFTQAVPQPTISPAPQVVRTTPKSTISPAPVDVQQNLLRSAGLETEAAGPSAQEIEQERLDALLAEKAALEAQMKAEQEKREEEEARALAEQARMDEIRAEQRRQDGARQEEARLEAARLERQSGGTASVNPRQTSSWIFGKPKNDASAASVQVQRPGRAEPPVEANETATGPAQRPQERQVFKDEFGDDVAIPAFMRRQAN